VATARQLGSVPQEAVARLLQARLALGANEPSKAEALAHDALGVLMPRRWLPAVADALEVLAEVAARLDAPEEAARELGAVDAARAGFGETLRLPGREREIAAIVAIIEEAMGPDDARAAREDGAALTLDDAVAWIRRARGTRKRPAVGWESLTPTEAQVVDLAAQGLTNPQIGEQMFISRATVKVHLAHVFQKLDVHNRAELTAQAVRREG
jgi:DNA-binding CsgD family transcriptional regulator